MIGAIIGDIVGSVYEFNNVKTKGFPLFKKESTFTDDSLMTIAVAKALTTCYKDLNTKLSVEVVIEMREMGKRYPHPMGGYGGRFAEWLKSEAPQPYNSFGNGAAMRVSPVAYFALTLRECIELSRTVTEVTHNHPEGIKGAECVAVLTYFARHGYSKGVIRGEALNYYPEIEDFVTMGIDEARDANHFDESCQGTVPQAVACFLLSSSFEDAIRKAMWIGGDSDTIGAITGAIAGAFYGIPNEMYREAVRRLDKDLIADLLIAEETLR